MPTDKPDNVRVLILGTGGMAHTHVSAYTNMPGVDVVAGVDVHSATLQNFCAKHQIEKHFLSLTDALDWGEFDAVSNVTPDNVHHQSSLAVLAAGKHILCEKPLATNFSDANEMASAAEASGVVNMVNLVYRDVPALETAASMVARGDIGPLRHFEASYLQSWLTQPAWGNWRKQAKWLWRLSSEHGSLGVLGDVGIHILDFTCYAAGSLPLDVSCRLKTFHKAPGDKIGEYTLDANDSFVLHAELGNGAIGSISASRFASGHHNDLRLRLYGEQGALEILFEKQVSRLNACIGGDMREALWREVQTQPVATSYERFIDAIRQQKFAAPDFRHGASLQMVLDNAVASQEQQSAKK